MCTIANPRACHSRCSTRSALLWRLYLEGEDTGGRFSELADAWVSRTVDEPWYVFNDMHAVMALVGAGRMTKAPPSSIGSSGTPQPGPPRASNLAMTAEVGLPASRAVVAFAEGNDRRVIDELLPIRATFQVFGGSHAQRDALQRTLLTSAIRAHKLDLATALVNERLATRESSVYTLSRFAEIANARADLVNAQRYTKAAASYRSQFAAAI